MIKCEDCEFWWNIAYDDEEHLYDDPGQCRRNPPTPDTTQPLTAIGMVGIRPVTNATDGCGMAEDMEFQEQSLSQG
jgi:hypothetical protein